MVKTVYKSELKFLGTYLTTKPHWKTHLETVLSKAIRKSPNLLKFIIKNSWGKDIKNNNNKNTLIHLTTSLVRSKLTCGQEVCFIALKSCLKKPQSLDSKAIKLALGIPESSNTLGANREVGILPLDEIRKLAAAKYINNNGNL